MVNRFLAVFPAAVLLPFATACGVQYSGPPADLVVVNAHVVTIDKANPRAEAVAVIGEEIVAVTTNRAV